MYDRAGGRSRTARWWHHFGFLLVGLRDLRKPALAQRLFFGFGISVILLGGRASTGRAGSVARIWSFVLPSVFSRKYQSESTRMSLLVVRLSFLARRISLIQR